ncbi:MAG: hypothetical protein KGJ23_11455 [Euryarchaeota archaeon]|nr:hypothetical protein [Euryarchaeota archaeon]MDE1837211.1 hypothetical protein [Euryarchaeota archaeon]MDE1881423.1 hypothetical protein [Euryarchaeota archaeon]MDE2045367.1 hypothetical protein [Thermoplasmata archaeon]
MPFPPDPRLAGWLHRNCSICLRNGTKTPAKWCVMGHYPVATSLTCDEHRSVFEGSWGVRFEALDRPSDH